MAISSLDNMPIADVVGEVLDSSGDIYARWWAGTDSSAVAEVV